MHGWLAAILQNLGLGGGGQPVPPPADTGRGSGEPPWRAVQPPPSSPLARRHEDEELAVLLALLDL